MGEPISADDIAATRFDRSPHTGEIHEETKLAIALQVLRSIRDDQIGVHSTVRALCTAALRAIESRMSWSATECPENEQNGTK